MITHGKAPFLECSSQGDKDFSAFFARLRYRNNKSIEEIYQGAKIMRDGRTGLHWKEAKGRADILNREEVKRLYSALWDEYIMENPHLEEKLITATGLSDMFGKDGHVCQATELWRIRELLINHRNMFGE